MRSKTRETMTSVNSHDATGSEQKLHLKPLLHITFLLHTPQKTISGLYLLCCSSSSGEGPLDNDRAGKPKDNAVVKGCS